MHRIIHVRNKRCPTGKIRYRSQGDAATALSSTKQRSVINNNRDHVEARYYLCSLCNGGYHLTSRPEKS